MTKRVLLATSLVAALMAAACGGDATAPQPEQMDVPTVTIGGAVYTVSGDPVPSLEVTVTTPDSTFVGHAAVGADGRFTVDAPAAASFDLLVEQPADSTPDYLPTVRRFGPGVPDGWQARVLLIPTTWKIQGGTYAGVHVPVSLDRIYHPDIVGGTETRIPLWHLYVWPKELLRDGDGPAVSLSTVTWPDSMFPIPLFIERDPTTVVGALAPVTPDDSVLLWEAIADINQRMGMRLFRPVREKDVPVDTVVLPNRVLPIPRPFAASFELFEGGTSNAAGADWACYGDQMPLSDSCLRYGPGNYVFGGATVIKLSADPIWRKVLQHELLHVVGLGHSCFEPSIMSYCLTSWLPGWTGSFSDGKLVSVFDVAYFQLLLAVHRRAEEVRPHLGVLEALQGERIRLLDKSRLPEDWWQDLQGA